MIKVCFDKSITDGTVWSWDLVAKFFEKFNDLIFGSLRSKKSFNVGDNLFAGFTDDIIGSTLWNTDCSLTGSFGAKSKFNANVEGFNFLFNEGNNVWNVVID